MKIIKDNDELKSYIKDGQITFDCSIKCDFNISVEANIKAWDIEAWNIKAGNIKARNIKAGNIDAGDISFYAFCISYITLKCKSISGRRENSFFKCLDNEVEYISADKIITIDGKDIKISEEYFNELKKQLL